MNKFIFTFTAVIFALALSSVTAYAAVIPTIVDRGTINVSGEAAVYLEPDVANISLGVETQYASPLEAQQRNSAIMADVIAAIRALGVDETDIQTARFFMHPVQDWSEGMGRTVGYMVSNHVNITVRDLDNVGAVLAAATGAGANAASSISFGLLDSSTAYNEALALAIADATSKAQTIAQALGVNLGSAMHVSESSFMSIRPFPAARAEMAFDAMGIAAAGAPPVQGGELAVTAQVQITFAINP